MIRRISILFLVGLYGVTSWAQSFDKSLLFQDDHAVDILHGDQFRDSSQWLLYLPSFNYFASQKGPKFTDYLYRDNQNRLLIDPNRALQTAEEENVFQSGGRVNVLSLAWKKENMILSAGYGLRYISHVDYPLQALSLYTAGNALIFGEQLDLSFDAQVQAMHSYHIGLNYQIGRLTIGGRVEYLSGIADLSVSRNKLNIEVAPLFYGISIDNDFLLNTTHLIDYQDIDEIVIDYSGDLGRSFFSANSGISFSFAASYEVDDLSQIEFKITDIGSVSWSEAPENFITEGQSSFGGVSILDLINVENRVSYRDSLETLIDIQETTESYATSMPVSLSASYMRKVHPNMSLSISGNMVNFYGRTNYSAGVSGRYQLHQKASVSASIAHSPYQAISIGIGGSIALGPIQIFAVTQNAAAIFNQLDAHYNYSSIGATVQF